MTRTHSRAVQPDTSTNDAESPLSDDIASLLKQVRSLSRRLSRAKNLLGPIKGKDLADKDAAAHYEAWLEVHSGLEGLELPDTELDGKRRRVVERIGGGLESLRIKVRMRLLTHLGTLAEERGLELQKVSEVPLTLFADPLTFEINFDHGDVRLLYGRELIDELPIDAATLLDARESAVAEIAEQAMESERFFDLLQAAYRTVLVAEGAAPGDRVDLVDVLMPLSMLRVDRKVWRRSGPDALEPFPRHLLAFQLAKLRRDGVLERNGARLELGAATGGSTRDKRDVLYVPVGATDGQYYGSLKFD